ncbi:SDR family oxidoreductase [Thermus scotoductus]|uniref:Short-chain dehydrogenase n=1 Tax=Thermus scotoductus TaxID=37636 RepID=A0A430VRI0_THESC|nr:SDR family oxidoreductase [Thermus scotoductus]RTG95901.1 short-chain dehydrogenase [Thermus scotoductus]RTH05403.1 short-chain dehydrogenase [Thermus scotoductus]RTH20219.1 short-chain dehydrogenase [Thermus scotoductus]RTI01475.1 short-chain dehydrogenase [Thermus scotoductus]RTI22255.1 short-chain dehydrogenase [Thermus scotoductus]
MFENKVAVVTGASRGIGRAIALALARRGADVVLAARDQARLSAVAGEIAALGRKAVVAAGDLRREEAVEALREAALSAFGTVDIVVNNAGVGKYGPLSDFSPEDYDWIMDTNMRASFLVTRAFLPTLLEKGSGDLVFVASVAGLKGLPHEAVYCASKFAQVGFAQALDHELRERGVRVSVVAPGGVKTEFAFGTGRTPGDPRLEGFLDPEEVAEAVVFALERSDKARAFLVGLRPMSEPL